MLLSLQLASVSQTAINAVAKIASYTPEIAEELVTSGSLADIVEVTKQENVSAVVSVPCRCDGAYLRLCGDQSKDCCPVRLPLHRSTFGGLEPTPCAPSPSTRSS